MEFCVLCPVSRVFVISRACASVFFLFFLLVFLSCEERGRVYVCVLELVELHNMFCTTSVQLNIGHCQWLAMDL